MAQIVQPNSISNLDSYLTALGYVANNKGIVPLALNEQTNAMAILTANPSESSFIGASLLKNIVNSIKSLVGQSSASQPVEQQVQGYLVTYTRGRKIIQVVFNQDPTQVANSNNMAINIRGAVLIQLSSGEILID